MKQCSKRPIRLLTFSQMSELTTPRLLAYRDRLLRVPDTKEEDGLPWTGVVTKADPRWRDTYRECLDLLNKREHVEKKRGPK